MAQLVVRLDPATDRALGALASAQGVTRSAAARMAIIAAEREQMKQRMRADAASIAADPADAAESAAVRSDMDARRAW